jgi:hypothetical protein
MENEIEPTDSPLEILAQLRMYPESNGVFIGYTQDGTEYYVRGDHLTVLPPDGLDVKFYRLVKA